MTEAGDLVTMLVPQRVLETAKLLHSRMLTPLVVDMTFKPEALEAHYTEYLERYVSEMNASAKVLQTQVFPSINEAHLALCHMIRSYAVDECEDSVQAYLDHSSIVAHFP